MVLRISKNRMDVGSMQMRQAQLQTYSKTLVSANVGGLYTVDLSQAAVFNLTLTQNTTLVFSNAPTSGTEGEFTLFVAQNSLGGSSITWPTSVRWSSGTAPTQSTSGNFLDWYTFFTTDGGTTWFGTQVAKGIEGFGTSGTLWAWGYNKQGQVGIAAGVGAAGGISSPVQLGTLSTWNTIAGGDAHSLAIKTDGTLWTWGQNAFGQLGFGDIVSRSSPTQLGALVNWSSISAGLYHSLTLKTDGTLWAMGKNQAGQLGLLDAVNRSSPVQVGALTTWSAISAAGYFSLGLKTDGSLWVWGKNDFGQLGITLTAGTATGVSSPVVIDSGTTWKAIAAGTYHALALKTDGTLWSWGRNNAGQIGDSTGTDRSSPVQIAGTSWTAIAAGRTHSLALQSSGTLWAWGNNANGSVGDSTAVNRSSPVQIGTSINWSSISAGKDDSFALKNDGTAWAWGLNSTDGELGISNTVTRSSPVQIGSATNWSTIAAGDYHVLAIQKVPTKINGTALQLQLWGWGDNVRGTLGDGTVVSKSSPVQIGTRTTWSALGPSGQNRGGGGAGGAFTLAIQSDGTLWSWGASNQSELGFVSAPNISSPTQVGSFSTWKQVTAGLYSGLGVKTDGTLWAWGYNTNGELGLSDVVLRSSPIQVGALTNWSQVSAGQHHVLAVKTDGTLWSWGYNGHGELGQQDAVSRSSPTQVGTATNWARVAAGDFFSLALKTDGTMWSWGNNFRGELGYSLTSGATTGVSSPAQIGSAATWTAIAAGDEIAFALKTDGTLWAWGTNQLGGLGVSTNAGVNGPNNSPLQVGGLANWLKIASGKNAGYAIKNDGTLWAWGYNTNGELGQGDTVGRSSPVQIGTDTTWVAVAGGTRSAFGLKHT